MLNIMSESKLDEPVYPQPVESLVSDPVKVEALASVELDEPVKVEDKPQEDEPLQVAVFIENLEEFATIFPEWLIVQEIDTLFATSSDLSLGIEKYYKTIVDMPVETFLTQYVNESKPKTLEEALAGFGCYISNNFELYKKQQEENLETLRNLVLYRLIYKIRSETLQPFGRRYLQIIQELAQKLCRYQDSTPSVNWCKTVSKYVESVVVNTTHTVEENTCDLLENFSNWLSRELIKVSITR
jgi:hypothetical protein